MGQEIERDRDSSCMNVFSFHVYAISFSQMHGTTSISNAKHIFVLMKYQIVFITTKSINRTEDDG